MIEKNNNYVIIETATGVIVADNFPTRESARDAKRAFEPEGHTRPKYTIGLGPEHHHFAVAGWPQTVR